jgi:hypothetical protein
MQREQGSDERAPPHGTGHPIQHQQQKEGVREMQRQARQMMPARIQAEELHVDHVRDPGHRSARRVVGMPKCPGKVVEREPARDVRVVDDEFAIVEVDELRVSYRCVDEDRQCSQRHSGKHQAATVRCRCGGGTDR